MNSSPGKRPEISVVIPTYMERANILPLLESLGSVLKNIPHEILVVDDDSPDGTWEAVRRYSEGHPAVSAIRRTGERGLSSAVLCGFRKAGGRFLAAMDGDLSHDPQVLPRMLEAARGGCEMAVGSRRVPGGGVDYWPWHRRFMSNVATWIARLCLSGRLHDPMSGYFVIRRELYERVKGSLHGKGYKICLEILARGNPENIEEVPFIFRDRSQGHSKLSARVVFQYLDMLFDIRLGFSPVNRFWRIGTKGRR